MWFYSRSWHSLWTRFERASQLFYKIKYQSELFSQHRSIDVSRRIIWNTTDWNDAGIYTTRTRWFSRDRRAQLYDIVTSPWRGVAARRRPFCPLQNILDTPKIRERGACDKFTCVPVGRSQKSRAECTERSARSEGTTDKKVVDLQFI